MRWAAYLGPAVAMLGCIIGVARTVRSHSWSELSWIVVCAAWVMLYVDLTRRFERFAARLP
jgi:hypothetical protein